jgi:hypothetical protein
MRYTNTASDRINNAVIGYGLNFFEKVDSFKEEQET